MWKRLCQVSGMLNNLRVAIGLAFSITWLTTFRRFAANDAAGLGLLIARRPPRRPVGTAGSSCPMTARPCPESPGSLGETKSPKALNLLHFRSRFTLKPPV
jgi:hypothetical protein